MMRDSLFPYLERPAIFRATFERHGCSGRTGGSLVLGTTLLLRDVTNTAGRLLAGHIWLTVDPTPATQSLRTGDKVEFEAQATPYEKSGSRTRRVRIDIALEIAGAMTVVQREEGTA